MVEDGGETPVNKLGPLPGGERLSLVERLLHHKHDLGSLKKQKTTELNDHMLEVGVVIQSPTQCSVS